jgi:hypothetical protein
LLVLYAERTNQCDAVIVRLSAWHFKARVIMEFFVSFPLYAVVTDIGLLVREPLAARARENGIVSVAVFTEELHAERAMQHQRPDGYIITISNSQELESYLRQSERLVGAQHVAIDPYAESGKLSRSYTIEDAINSISGSDS